MYQLTYAKIPDNWNDGLPFGNGRLAAMYWGGTQKDVLSLNHERLWRGKYRGKEAPKSASYLPELRRLLREKDYFRAGVFANLFFGGLSGICGVGETRTDKYLTAGNMVFEFSENTQNCESTLDIINGTVEVKRDKILKSSFFCNSNDGCLMSKWQSSRMFSGLLYLERELDEEADCSVSYQHDRVELSCSYACGVSYRVQTMLKTDGNVYVTEKGLNITHATVLICTTNIIVNQDDDRACNLDFDMLIKEHSKSFSSYMNRVTFYLDQEESLKPTDCQVAEFRSGVNNDKLLELYFHYGRYLMVSSCICASLPPHLQGKWTTEPQPDGYADYHFDINQQMNEWMIESANCSEFAEALADYMLSFIKSGQVAARNMFGCRGIWIPMFCDVWAECTPEAFGYPVWVGAAAWMAQPLWQHYVYTGDENYLRDKAYEYFKEVALFYEDFLEEDENGIMQIMPSQSPENRFVGAGRLVVAGICSSSAMDVQLAYDAFGYAINAARILKVDEEKVQKWECLRSKLPPFAIGSDGRLMEWNEEFQEEWPGYKHLSHLYGLFPSDIFTPGKRPAEYEAAIKSFRHRIAYRDRTTKRGEGVDVTGWGQAWAANVSARIGDKEGFYDFICDMIRRLATESLLDTHPHIPDPGVEVFQIDGNFGMVSAVIEALCSYFDDRVHLLRALPDSWSNGTIDGIKLPGGHTLGFSWEDGKVKNGVITMGFQHSGVLEFDGEEHIISGKPGEKISFGCK